MSREQQIEGLVLRSIDYKDNARIITLFTLTHGLISLIVKKISPKKTELLILTSPLTHAKYHVISSRSDLYRFHDGALINAHLDLRKKLAHITSAATFAKALLRSQLPEKPAPMLYQMTLTYLQRLPSFDDPTALCASFYLKLLKHDGHLSLNTQCTVCTNPPIHLHLGEPYCSTHVPFHTHPLTSSEWAIMQKLTEARSFSILAKLQVSKELYQKIQSMFKDQFAVHQQFS